MARKVQVLLVDDLDGSDLGTNGETLAFGMGGERYEIDLSKQHAEKFRTMMGEYVEHARNVTRQGGGSSRRNATSSTRSASDRDETKRARQWLVDNGWLSADSRGRISSENWQRYHEKTPNPSRPQIPGTEAKPAPSLAETKREVPAKTAPAKAQGNSTTGAKDKEKVSA